MASIDREQIAVMNMHYKRFSLDYFLDSQQRLGVHNIELWCGASHFWLDAKGHEETAPLKKKLKERDLKVVSLTSPSCAYQYQYAAQEELWEKSYGYFLNGLHTAAELGAQYMTVNSGWGYLDEPDERMWDRSARMLRKLAEKAAEYGLICVLESMRADETNIVNSIETTKKMFDLVRHSNFKIMIDTIASGDAGETLEEWFETFGEDLVHLHFLDGDPYVHNIWGDGNTSLEKQLEVLNKYNFKGYLVQEIADEKYFSDPFRADRRNLRVLNRFVNLK